MNQKLNDLWKKLTADKKKASLMAFLLLVMLLLWGRLLLKQVPRTAVAEPATTAAVEAGASPLTGHPSMRRMAVDLATTLDRDPFRFDKDRYPLTDPALEPAEQEKSVEQTPDESERIEKIRRWARDLQLQAAVLGQEPKALINDQVYRMGDQIDGFAVVAIEPRQVVLRQGRITIRLQMGD